MSIQTKSIIVEGNIGAGKSTFLRRLQDSLHVEIVYEPHHKWQNVGGENVLDYFYKDTQRWAYTFQTYAFVSRIMAQEESAAKTLYPSQVLERSVYSDRYCFAKNAYELGFITSLEWNMYKEWWAWFVQHYTTKPAGFIYLKTTPDVAYERIQKRSRFEESSVSYEYIEKLHDKHEAWLVHKEDVESYLVDVPVLELDCTKDFENHEDVWKNHVDEIITFFSDACNLELKIKNQVSWSTDQIR